MNTNAEQRDIGAEGRSEEAAVPLLSALQHHQAPSTGHSAHTAQLGTATLRFLGFSFRVAQAKHCPLCPLPTPHHLYRVFLLAMYNSID